MIENQFNLALYLFAHYLKYAILRGECFNLIIVKTFCCLIRFLASMAALNKYIQT
jgi:hypothetical protein